jgi:hypothetical protein
MNFSWKNAGAFKMMSCLGITLMLEAPVAVIVTGAQITAGAFDVMKLSADKAVLTFDDGYNPQTYHIIDVGYTAAGDYKYLAIHSMAMPTPLPEVPYSNAVLGDTKSPEAETRKVVSEELGAKMDWSDFGGRDKAEPAASNWTDTEGKYHGKRTIGRQSEADKLAERIADIAAYPLRERDEPVNATEHQSALTQAINTLRTYIESQQFANEKVFQDAPEAAFEDQDEFAKHIDSSRSRISYTDWCNEVEQQLAAEPLEEEVVEVEDDNRYEAEQVLVFYPDSDHLTFERIHEVQDEPNAPGGLILVDVFDRIIMPRAGWTHIIAEQAVYGG